jgi:hypothetical protein
MLRSYQCRVERFGQHLELYDDIAREAAWFSFALFLSPDAEEGGLIVTHDDRGTRAADKMATFD